MGRQQQQQQQPSPGKAFDYSVYSGAAKTAFKMVFYSYAAYFIYTQASSFIATARKKKKKEKQLCLQVETLDHKLQSYSDSFREASNGTRGQSLHRGRDSQLKMEVRIPS